METFWDEPPLTAEELKALDKYLQSHQGMSLIQAHGFLSALISNPCELSVMTWMPKLLGEHNPYPDVELLQHVLNQLMRFHQQIADAFEQEDIVWPLVELTQTQFGGEEEDIERLGLTANDTLKAWCQGYLRGIGLDYYTWEHYGKEDIQKLLVPIMVLAGN